MQQQEGCKSWQGKERKTHVRCACGTSSGFSQKEIDLKQVEVETKGKSKCTAHLRELGGKSSKEVVKYRESKIKSSLMKSQKKLQPILIIAFPYAHFLCHLSHNYSYLHTLFHSHPSLLFSSFLAVLEPAFPMRDVTINRNVDAHKLYDVLGEVGR